MFPGGQKCLQLRPLAKSKGYEAQAGVLHYMMEMQGRLEQAGCRRGVGPMVGGHSAREEGTEVGKSWGAGLPVWSTYSRLCRRRGGEVLVWRR